MGKEPLFENVGRSLKLIASIFCICGRLFLILIGCLFIIAALHNPYWSLKTFWYLIPIGISLIYVSKPLAEISVAFLYGFGELIEKVCQLEQHFCKEEKTEDTEKTTE